MTVQLPSTSRISAAEAAYVFGYPLVLMEHLRIAMTDVPAPRTATLQAPPNRIVHALAPGRDDPGMLRSSAWLDLSDGPVVLSVPNTHGHYYAASLIDMWSGTFASVGPRTTGIEEAAYAIAGPDAAGATPLASAKPVTAPTRYARLSVLTYAGDGAGEVQAGIGVRPLRGRRHPRLEADPSPGPPPADRARAEVDALDGRAFFAELGRLAAMHPPAPEDREALAGLDALLADPDVLDAGAARGREAVRASTASLYERSGRWATCYATGGDYARRAAAAYAGLSDHSAADRLCARAAGDAAGAPLSGRHRYLLRFADGSLPPARAFWTLSARGESEAYAIGNPDGLALDRDGALEIHIQSGAPRAVRAANWLRTPPGTFTLELRLAWPGDDALERRWTPPDVVREG